MIRQCLHDTIIINGTPTDYISRNTNGGSVQAPSISKMRLQTAKNEVRMGFQSLVDTIPPIVHLRATRSEIGVYSQYSLNNITTNSELTAYEDEKSNAWSAFAIKIPVNSLLTGYEDGNIKDKSVSAKNTAVDSILTRYEDRNTNEPSVPSKHYHN
jgi:hypothetical protein